MTLGPDRSSNQEATRNWKSVGNAAGSEGKILKHFKNWFKPDLETGLKPVLFCFVHFFEPPFNRLKTDAIKSLPFGDELFTAGNSLTSSLSLSLSLPLSHPLSSSLLPFYLPRPLFLTLFFFFISLSSYSPSFSNFLHLSLTFSIFLKISQK